MSLYFLRKKGVIPDLKKFHCVRLLWYFYAFMLLNALFLFDSTVEWDHNCCSCLQCNSCDSC